MKKYLIRFLNVFAVAVVLQFAAVGSKADVPMTQFADSVTIGISVDTAYQYVFGCDKEKASENCPGERGLYPEHNDFSIDAFTISLEKEPDGAGATALEKIGFRADILFGEQAERLGFGFNSDDDGAVSPYQAYINIAPTEQWNIYAGQFTTLAGWELIEAKNNTNISRSLLFYRIPFAHSGARVSFSQSGLVVTVGLSNDWDAVDDVNDGKTLEFQAAYSRSSETDIINDIWFGATVYAGKSEFIEDNAGFDADKFLRIFNPADAETSNLTINDDNKTRTLLTIVGSLTSGRFTFVGDAEFTWVPDGFVETVSGTITGDNPDTTDVETTFVGTTGVKYEDFFRWGVGGYAIYQASPNTTLSLRTEYVDDSDTAAGVKLFEITPTVGWRPFGSGEMGTLETRLEYRWDRADEKYFETDDGLEKNQHSLLFQFLYWI